MDCRTLKQKYLDFFKTKKHAIIKSASLIPENDPTVLFTTAGMHPLVPFLMGQKHPMGTRLANVQKCIRTGDIDEVGDYCHLSFFEMLGNWSLGDYFKKEAIEWSFEFLTGKDWLNIPIEKLAVSCFKGDSDAPKDEEAAGYWEALGIPESRIAFLPKKDNWWGPAGTTGPCGPDTEMFYWIGSSQPPENFDSENPDWVEIWNDVFMQYNKQENGKYLPLEKQNVDTGLGVERVAMVLQGKDNVYDIEIFQPIIEKIKFLANIKEVTDEEITSLRIISDHARASCFILGDNRGISPGNVDQGYILRRFIRRAIRHGNRLGINKEFLSEMAEIIIPMYSYEYDELEKNRKFIIDELKKEDEKFRKTLVKGLNMFEKLSTDKKEISGKDAFLLFQSYGFPIETTVELAKEKRIKVDEKDFYKEFKKHQELSRVGAEKRFKGGLSEASEITAKLHTATHILGEALRKILKNPDIKQKGSNITSERLRYDFNFDRKLKSEELKDVEDEVNKQIKKQIEIVKKEMPPEEAIKQGAQAEFGAKYPSKVSVYFIGDYTKDVCMGPHVSNTSDLGHFKIIKEESSAAGIRRIKAVLEQKENTA